MFGRSVVWGAWLVLASQRRRQDVEVLAMGWAYEEKIAWVNRRHAPGFKPLGNRHNAGIDEVQPGIGVSADQLPCTMNILHSQRFDLEAATFKELQKLNNCGDATGAPG